MKTADGWGWKFFAIGENAALLVLQLKHAFGIDRQVQKIVAFHKTKQIKNITVSVSQRKTRWRDLPAERAHEIVCRVGPVYTPEKMAFQLTHISQVVANASETKGGLLVHGALAEWNGIGVILAGPGSVGKTTASRRLPHPWHSLSDDTTLIVKSSDGTYWAHPWPTWSRYRAGDMSGSWDVQAAVKLGLICMLSRNKKDRAFQLSIRQAISELVDVSGQTFAILADGMSQGALRHLNLIRFHNAVRISKNIPICRLEISLKGEFWKEIEKFLGARMKNWK